MFLNRNESKNKFRRNNFPTGPFFPFHSIEYGDRGCSEYNLRKTTIFGSLPYKNVVRLIVYSSPRNFSFDECDRWPTDRIGPVRSTRTFKLRPKGKGKQENHPWPAGQTGESGSKVSSSDCGMNRSFHFYCPLSFIAIHSLTERFLS